jgi:hypothetical protein
VILFRRFREGKQGLDGIKPGRWHGIMPALAKGLTAAKPVHAEVTAFERPVVLQGLQSIC